MAAHASFFLPRLSPRAYPGFPRKVSPSLSMSRPTLDSLLTEEDTDNDNKITIEDHHVPRTNRGDKQFWLSTTGGRRIEIVGTYYLSNLLQELSLARNRSPGYRHAEQRSGSSSSPPTGSRDRSGSNSGMGSTRRLDEEGLPKIFADPKAASLDGRHYVFVAPSDTSGISVL